MISQLIFYIIKFLFYFRFVLFKRHYEKYLDISRKYEEARSLAYYLEEKYHEIKVIFFIITHPTLLLNNTEQIYRSIYILILFCFRYSVAIVGTFTNPHLHFSDNTHNNKTALQKTMMIIIYQFRLSLCACYITIL